MSVHASRPPGIQPAIGQVLPALGRVLIRDRAARPRAVPSPMGLGLGARLGLALAVSAVLWMALAWSIA